MALPALLVYHFLVLISPSFFYFPSDTTTTTKVHEHGLKGVVASEQLSLLDENVVGKKIRNKSGTSTSPVLSARKFHSSAGSPASPTGRYDYSIVQHLDSTDI